MQPLCHTFSLIGRSEMTQLGERSGASTIVSKDPSQNHVVVKKKKALCRRNSYPHSPFTPYLRRVLFLAMAAPAGN